MSLNEEFDRLSALDEHFEKSTKFYTNLKSQHDDFLVQFSSVKQTVDKLHSYLRQYKRKCAQTNDENHHLHMQTKILSAKIDDFHRTENLMSTKIDEQEMDLSQLRKELK